MFLLRNKMLPVADPEVVQGVCLTPSPSLVFKYAMKMKLFGLSETKLFHFHGIFKRNGRKSVKQTPTPLYIHV